MKKIRDVNVVEGMMVPSYEEWVLLPKPIASLSSPKKRKEFEQAVRDARCDLVHEKWEGARDAARELSDMGGIETVQIVRIRHAIIKHVAFKDGKQVVK